MTGMAMPLALATGAVAAGVSSGMMLAFSAGTMRGLSRLPEAEAVRAMQAINVSVINPLFLGVFIGTGPLLVALSGIDLYGGSPNRYLLAATLVYVVGVVAVTILGNVPLNDRLAAVDTTTMGPGTWDGYAGAWLRYNHTRALAGAVASGLLTLALLAPSPGSP
ncbi:MAG: DUF1772 domain-containing protein [Myxococcota bacterium]|nr:DUF1772 domain-containing protein [Myxococcota bacterium]